ncbi:MAG: TlpA disulfide reductase family protein [Bacteroidota bacterium]|nr:TlpA disulfide reductase family protein [Bacteroidota bacterium]MDP3145141.1 TlpA disulfide reductase family protein [Bacteroidota bacterium]MDP3556176.1 TlpA disulfide reductase family protein [Bacteroidota bacterium]
MFRTISAIALMAILSGCSETKRTGNFELKGTLTNSNGETIYLEKLINPQPVTVDSAIVDEKGNFEFKTYTPNIGFYRIKLNQQNFAVLVLDSNDKVTVTANIKDLGNTYKVEGSEETSLFIMYNELTKKNKLQIDSLNMAFQELMRAGGQMDSLRMDSLSNVFEKPFNDIMNSFNDMMAEKIMKNCDKYASIMAIQGMDPEKYAEVYKKLDSELCKKFPSDKNVKTFHEVLNKMLSTTSGQEAPEIILPTPDGKDLALSSLRGKIVLVDFWASWCGPCRKEMPNVVKAYAKYKDKGFEIYGVSLDQDKGRWVEAIEKDGMTWPQVSDLKYWDSYAAKLYAVEGIPYTVLLDKEGKIIGKNLRGADLEKAIEKAISGK